MIKILKYTFFDLIRSRWSYVYFAFYLLLGFVLLFLNNDLSKGIVTLTNMVTVLVPLISTIFGTMYFYSSKEFTELLLAQPIGRKSIFMGLYLGVALSLSISLIVGLGIPFIIYGLFESNAIWNFSLLLVVGTFLTLIFTSLAFNVAIRNDNKIKGFGYAVLLWLFLAVIYDGIFLMSLIVFEEYPLDIYSLSATLLNPIDLSRILIILKLDISALLGYTGAIFKSFFGTSLGIYLAFLTMILWIITPTLMLLYKAKGKDF